MIIRESPSATISIIMADEQEFTIHVYDQLGRKKYEIPKLVLNVLFGKHIHLRSAPMDVYTVIFRNIGGNVIRKFIANR